MNDGRPYSAGSRVDDLDLSDVHLHGANLDGSRLTDTSLCGADISGYIDGLRINGVEVDGLVQAELDRRFPEQVRLRATDVASLRRGWSMLEDLWADTTRRAADLPPELQWRRVEGEWSFVETLRHLIFATDCWLFRAVQLARHPYHPWGLTWSGAGPEWAREVGVDPSATPELAQVLPVRRERQQSVRTALDVLTDAELSDVRAAPEEPGHPRGEHSVLHCLHVLLNEEWQHHRYATRDLDILEG